MDHRHWLVFLAWCSVVTLSPGQAWAQYGATDGEWRSYGGDLGSTKYSPLDQIDAGNFSDLRPAWRWQSADGLLDLDAIRAQLPRLGASRLPGRQFRIRMEAAVVRRIFQLCAEGHGITPIAKQLNAERAPCPRAQQGRPSGWAPSSVREVLHRALYRGEIVWNKTRKRDAWGQTKHPATPGGGAP